MKITVVYKGTISYDTEDCDPTIFEGVDVTNPQEIYEALLKHDYIKDPDLEVYSIESASGKNYY